MGDGRKLSAVAAEETTPSRRMTEQIVVLLMVRSFVPPI
jgi:hypothetical protein